MGASGKLISHKVRETEQSRGPRSMVGFGREAIRNSIPITSMPLAEYMPGYMMGSGSCIQAGVLLLLLLLLPAWPLVEGSCGNP